MPSEYATKHAVTRRKQHQLELDFLTLGKPSMV